MTTKVCIFNSTTNLIDVTDGVSVYSGSPAQAFAPVVLNASGALDSSFYNSSPVLATAAQSLTAGQLVNLYYGTVGLITTVYVRLASSNALSAYPAMGFVTTSYNPGDPCTVLTTGLVNVPLSGAVSSDVGLPVYLSNTTPGSATLTQPTNPDLIQPLGYIYQVLGSTVEFPFLSFPLAAANQTPIATTSQAGVVKPDGTTIDIASGVISVPTATTGTKGLVQPDGTTIAVNGSGVISVTGFLPLTGGTLSGALSVTGGVTIVGASAGSFINADGTGSTILSSANLSDDDYIIHGAGGSGYIALFTGIGSPPLSPPLLSPPLSPPTSTNFIADSHLDDGLTEEGTITSSEPVVVQGPVTAAYLIPYTIYSATLGNPLPAADASLQGVQAVVSDATSPAYMQPYVSGGTVTCAVICSYDGAGSPPTYQWLTH